MVWTSANGPKCPVSPEDRGEFMEPSDILLRRLVDWTYLHASEGNCWPSSKTVAHLIDLALERGPTQAEMDAFKEGGRFPSSTVSRPEGKCEHGGPKDACTICHMWSQASSQHSHPKGD